MEEFPEAITAQCPHCGHVVSATKFPDQVVTLTCQHCGHHWTPQQ